MSRGVARVHVCCVGGLDAQGSLLWQFRAAVIRVLVQGLVRKAFGGVTRGTLWG